MQMQKGPLSRSRQRAFSLFDLMISDKVNVIVERVFGAVNARSCHGTSLAENARFNKIHRQREFARSLGRIDPITFGERE